MGGTVHLPKPLGLSCHDLCVCGDVMLSCFQLKCFCSKLKSVVLAAFCEMFEISQRFYLHSSK